MLRLRPFARNALDGRKPHVGPLARVAKANRTIEHPQSAHRIGFGNSVDHESPADSGQPGKGDMRMRRVNLKQWIVRGCAVVLAGIAPAVSANASDVPAGEYPAPLTAAAGRQQTAQNTGAVRQVGYLESMESTMSSVSSVFDARGRRRRTVQHAEDCRPDGRGLPDHDRRLDADRLSQPEQRSVQQAQRPVESAPAVVLCRKSRRWQQRLRLGIPLRRDVRRRCSRHAGVWKPGRVVSTS